jgi:hypothetical protein
MTKKQKQTTQLYDHNASSALHRNISVTEDGRRRRTSTNLVNLPSDPAPTSSYEPAQEAGYVNPFEDKRVPINTENPEDISGVKVKAKQYENSVRHL